MASEKKAAVIGEPVRMVPRHDVAEEDRMLFPMYVVRVPSFLGMTEALPHQVLKAKGLAVDFHTLGEAVSIFVSHQWCSRQHADPQFKQLGMLQVVLRKLMAGDVVIAAGAFAALQFGIGSTVHVEDFRRLPSWSIWYDYFSVPQPAAPVAESSQHADLEGDLGKAVASLSCYVHSSRFFFILAPAVQHTDGHGMDYATWRSRGWCRLERLARVLSPNQTHMLLVRRCDTIFEITPDDYLNEPVGRGNFGYDGDRERLGPLVERLLADKLAALLAADAVEDYRRLLSWGPMLVQGVPADWRRTPCLKTPYVARLETGGGGDAADELLRLMRADAQSRRPLSVEAALLLASAVGDVPAMESLLLRRAHVECREPKDDLRYLRFRGEYPVHAASAGGHVEALSLLVARRAGVNVRARTLKADPLGAATKTGDVNALRFLLRCRADIDFRNAMGASALDTAAFNGRLEATFELLEAGARLEERPNGTNPLHGVAFNGSGAGVVRALLEGRASPNGHLDIWKIAFSGRIFIHLAALGHRLGSRNFWSMLAYHLPDITPLHFAMMHAHWSEARALLEGRADPDAQNSPGYTPRQVAAIFGTSHEMPFIM